LQVQSLAKFKAVRETANPVFRTFACSGIGRTRRWYALKCFSGIVLFSFFGLALASSCENP
jgi:hypothetical protein